MKKIFFTTIVFCVSFAVNANVIINGTRVIYPKDNKEVIVQLYNNGDSPSLVQSWIDDGDINSTPETSKAPFLVSPPVVKVDGHSGQQVGLKLLGNTLPSDKESMFYLNVLDIPPTPDNLNGMNTIQMAIRSRIKVIVRPKEISSIKNTPSTQLIVSKNSNGVQLDNKGAYFINIANIICGQDSFLKEPLILRPFTRENIDTIRKVDVEEKCNLTYVDDLGAYTKVVFTIK
ncbi:fimbria/pilus periplasmic chaperone [Rosenbergiella sp. S61]|uniref:Fimbria/pilus periplasmic chaperone n=1 Tax=Rosenbergiella gaditana TaxID=2726987 RepID=A0ABS5SYB6_9GAMM|nr:fimbria/pilus periplasmic chaperone [Rosenbergiella gaditana]MBT0724902.1 fimbria/pilus periplasmic chaperone [Rosenbergiella gaditana]